MNLNSVLRLTARVTGVREFTKLDRAIKNTEKAARDGEKAFKKMLDSRLFRTAAVAAAGLSAAIALSTKAATDFESSMADVRKVVDGLESPKAFKEISQEILDLSNRMPIAAKGFADIFAAAGQAGIPRKELKAFAEEVAKTAIAFDMTAKEAGTAMAKIKTSLSMSLDELNRFTDAINHLSNNTASTAKELVDFTLRAGAVGKSAGLAAKDTAAIGAAMIAAGAESNVAATSFRNVIKALSRGSSMTDRQIDALKRLGYAQSSAVTNEAAYSDAVRRESENRIDIARRETNQLAKELNRRFRDQMTSLRDEMDDETEAYTEGLQDRAEEQIKQLRRQESQELDALRKREQATGKSQQKEIYALQDSFEEKIDAIRDNLRDELKERRRADRDKLTRLQDQMDDEKEVQLDALEKNFEDIKAKEKALMEERLAEIKSQAEAGATKAAEALAKGLQEDAVGTITDVFERIRELPKEAQLSTISDLFGDEARAIQPLIQDLDLLKKSLNLVANEQDFAGSKTDEFLARVATTANQIQQAKNQVENLAIVFGQTLAPALGSIMEAFSPLVQGFAKLLTDVPILAPIIATLGIAFIGLTAALPAIAGLISIVAQLGGSAALLAGAAKAAALFKGAVVALGGAFAALKGAFAVVAGILSGPVGWAALIGIALGAVYTFRDEIGAVFYGIASTIVDAFINLGATLIGPFQNAIAWINQNFFDKFKELFTSLTEYAKEIWSSFTDTLTAPFNAVAETLKSVFNSILQKIANIVNVAIGLLNNTIKGANLIPGINIPVIPQLSIPEFAEGGMVNGAQLAIVGEAGPEYIVPAGKAQAFAKNILAGVRGPGAIPAYAEGGYVGPVNITTGPVMQQGGTNYVTMAQFEAGIKDAANAVARNSRSYGARRFTGIS